jgi:hypothetical protein
MLSYSLRVFRNSSRGYENVRKCSQTYTHTHTHVHVDNYTNNKHITCTYMRTHATSVTLAIIRIYFQTGRFVFPSHFTPLKGNNRAWPGSCCVIHLYIYIYIYSSSSSTVQQCLYKWYVFFVESQLYNIDYAAEREPSNYFALFILQIKKNNIEFYSMTCVPMNRCRFEKSVKRRKHVFGHY